MNCKCVKGIVLGIIIIVFALWQTTYSKWIIVVAAGLLILHGIGFGESSCCTVDSKMMNQKAKPQAKSKKKKR